MKNKTVIITGASSGVGKAIASNLKKQGANVVIVGRSPEKTKDIGKELHVPYYIADFTKLDDVRKLGAELKAAYPHIDILFNNAGGIFGNRELTVDGNEKTMQVNHLAHFLLTYLLFDNLLASRATIINTASTGHLQAKLDVDDLNMEKSHKPFTAYANAKLEDILFAKEFQRRYGKTGMSMVSFHPGNVKTNFANASSPIMHAMYHSPLQALFFMIPPEKGAETGVWLATGTPGKDFKPGEYYSNKKLGMLNKKANDPVLGRRLWEESEKLVGIQYLRV